MILKQIEMTNFRNYDHLSLSLHPHINIIYGENGQGKSNLLESIYVLGQTKSHRSSIDNHLIKEGVDFSKITGILEEEALPTKLEIVLTDTSKKMKVDENEISKVSEYISHLDVIIFYPEDLEIIKGAPMLRRKFINTELSNLQEIYYNVLTDYNKLLKMRNEYLKGDIFDIHYFDILTQYFIQKAVLLYKMRLKFIDRINEYAENIYENLMHIKGFHIVYKVADFSKEDAIVEENLYHFYEENKEKERLYKKTLFGPHHDDLIFYIENKDMLAYSSQGQQRAAILTFKLAEIELYKKYKKRLPIILLDDVFSELDHQKKNNLMKYIGQNLQVIITTTELDHLTDKQKKNAKFIQIENGKVKKQEEVI